jgi:hypothetical protein
MSSAVPGGDDLIKELTQGLGVKNAPPKNYSLGKDTSVRTIVYLLANLCRANNDYREMHKMVDIMFSHLAPEVGAKSTRVDPADVAIDQFLQGFDVPQVIAAAYTRAGIHPAEVYLNAAIHAAEAALVELFQLHRYGSNSASYGAMCSLATVLITYGERKVTVLGRRYSELCTKVPGVHKTFVNAIDEVRKIATKNTEGAGRSVDDFYFSLGSRVAEMNLYVKRLHESIERDHPNSVDKQLTEDEQLASYNREIAEVFSGAPKHDAAHDTVLATSTGGDPAPLS